jgi:hypothetical protein
LQSQRGVPPFAEWKAGPGLGIWFHPGHIGFGGPLWPGVSQPAAGEEFGGAGLSLTQYRTLTPPL